MSLTWLKTSYNDPSLVAEIRERLSAEFSDVTVGDVVYYGSGYFNGQYFIQITAKDLPKGAHYEYVTDGWQGYLNFILRQSLMMKISSV